MAAAAAAAPEGELAVDVLGERNPRGIPAMRFLENVEAFIKDNNTNPESLIQAYYTMHNKYKFMETHTLENRQRMRLKLPEIERSLEMLEMLKAKRDAEEILETHFSLADNVYASARVEPEDKVCLWLGANVMMEYSYEEAETLLRENLEAANRKLEDYEEDLNFLREQSIVTQVNISRTFNYEVQKRRERGET